MLAGLSNAGAPRRPIAPIKPPTDLPPVALAGCMAVQIGDADLLPRKGNTLMANSVSHSLVTADWLHEHINDPKVRLFEVSVDPGVYAGGHIP
jgi:hypothetical protein